ncbi:uncharacterized protein LOC132797026 [Drosophila nasuta]|uniref:uncharacterized protein LOC132797026 n=1 Tax=Drosophila nasuta TaxID=42062 RepID=UPI00295EE355|nr:uncharacterized protein LOC132797026 [Drosophila nasuta]
MEIFENICRTCGNDCLDAINIFVDSVMVQGKNVPISEIIAACTPSFASLPAVYMDDDYPQQICRVCIKKLIMVYEFNNKWLAAHNEFAVALKFEQRRNRSRISSSQATAAVTVAAAPTTTTAIDANDQLIETDDDENFVFKTEPNEGGEMEIMNHAPPTNYHCGLCGEPFHTVSAYQKHHKISHRNCEFLYYTPGQ